MEYDWEFFEDVFDMKCQKQCAEVTNKNYVAYLEVIFGYYPDCRYNRLCSKSRHRLHTDIFDYVETSMKGKFISITSERYTEESYTKKIHLHGIYRIEISKAFNVEGLVMEFVNIFYSQLQKRSQLHQKNYHYCHKYQCFRSPPLLIQYRESENIERGNVWNAYIKKSQDIV